MQSSMNTLTIQEVSQRFGVTKHTLRFWEKALDGVIVPMRTPGGQRRYTPMHLFIIDEIIKLKKKRFSLTEIKREMGNQYNKHPSNSIDQRIDLLANRIADMVKLEIFSYFEEQIH